MNMKKGMILALLVSVFAIVSASNKMAIDYYDSGEFLTAKSHFLAEKVDATDCYYLGQIYLKTNKGDSAKYYFDKGLQIDPTNIYNNIGLAALKMSSDAKTADQELKAISNNKLYKKDAKMLTAIAEAYFIGKNAVQANAYLVKAKKADKKSPWPYILEGDQFLAQKNSGDAAAKYENAVYFDPNSKIAYLKLAQLYENIRTQVAFDYLKKAIAVDPTYAFGLSTLGEMSYRKGFYPQALETYQKYMELVKPTTKDYEQLATIKYFNKDYQGVLSAIDKASNTFVMNRLKMYSEYELGHYDLAAAIGENFMKTTIKNDIIPQDYSYYANALKKLKRFGDAAANYELAYQADTAKINFLSEAASAYDKAKDYQKAIKVYQKIIDVKPSFSMGDIYSLGSTYYNVGVDTTVTKDKFMRIASLHKADSTFKVMSEKFPDHYLAYLSRARANSALDPETTQGLAKPYYEKALEVMLPNLSERKNDILECYRYLGYFYYVKNDLVQSKMYWNKVLEIEPNDTVSLQVIKNIDSLSKKKK